MFCFIFTIFDVEPNSHADPNISSYETICCRPFSTRMSSLVRSERLTCGSEATCASANSKNHCRISNSTPTV